MVLDFDNEIEILLHDQEKIVSYKELSNRFDITPSQSQDLLSKFIEKKRHEDKTIKFYVTFLIIGINHQTKCKRISLVNESDIDSFEKENKIVSKKVYSIQNFKIEDFNILFSNDVDTSTNIDSDKIPDNIEAKSTSTVKNESLAEKIQPKPLETAKKTSSDLLKQKENVPDQKENKKGLVKEEPMDTSEPKDKKTKFGEDTKQKSVTAKPAAKPTAKQPSKQQSTLTSFFKKA